MKEYEWHELLDLELKYKDNPEVLEMISFIAEYSHAEEKKNDKSKPE